ncbi:MAG TPA: hypothetical protein VKZ97_10045 [Flavobacteriaceae bacterium]|nr:hypothetical protein [Flavobacteriaceae bacterium]
MKRLLVLATVLLSSMATVSALETNTNLTKETLDVTTRYRYAQPIMFVERGVEFLIFPDGSFDFNTNPGDYGDVYYRTTQVNTRRSSVNVTYGAPAQAHYGGVIITHDRDGKVRRIGNVFINYDREGKIKRAGSVYMTYNRGNGRLTQVGGLQVNFNAWGEIVHTSGQVNRESAYINSYTGVASTPTYYGNDSGYVDDEDFYYYRKGKEVKKQKKLKS